MSKRTTTTVSFAEALEVVTSSLAVTYRRYSHRHGGTIVDDATGETDKVRGLVLVVNERLAQQLDGDDPPAA